MDQTVLVIEVQVVGALNADKTAYRSRRGAPGQLGSWAAGQLVYLVPAGIECYARDPCFGAITGQPFAFRRQPSRRTWPSRGF